MIYLSKMKKSCLISISILLAVMGTSAQERPEFEWEAPLPEVRSAGFYRIPVTPALSAKAWRNGEWDIRIFRDSAEIPYFIERNYEWLSEGDFIAYATPELVSVPGKETVIVFEPKPQQAIREFGLRYANTAVKKNVVLTGSNDRQLWYALRPPFQLDPAAAVPVKGKDTIIEETITLPVSGFRYFRLVINDSASAPILFNCVGFRRDADRREVIRRIGGVPMQLLKGKDRRTDRFLVVLPAAYPLSELRLQFLQPQMYRRDAVLFAIENGRERQLAFGSVSSEDSVSRFPLREAEACDSLVVQVENGDNPPLVPGDAELWQDEWVMTAQLEPGRYALRGGALGQRAPVYDAAYFAMKYRRQAGEVLAPGDPVVLQKDEAGGESKTFFTSKWWVWLGIVLVVGLLGFVVRSMVREMKKNRD